MIDLSTCSTCGHLAVLRECEHASDRVTPRPLDLAIATTAATLALAVVLAGSHSWLGAWAYFVAVALAAWTPSWLVAPIALAGVVVPLLTAPVTLRSLGASLMQAAILGIAIVVIRRARRQRDELVARRGGAQK